METPKQSTEDPICPYCNNAIPHLNFHKWEREGVLLTVKGSIGAFSCPSCKKLLGVASVAFGSE